MTEARQQRSIPDVFHDMANHIQEIIRSEFVLAKTEVKEQASRSIQPIIMLGTGAIFGFWCVGFLLLTAMFGIGLALPAWLSALIVGMLAGIIALALIGMAISGFKRIRAPEKTIRTVRENVQWAKEQMR